MVVPPILILVLNLLHCPSFYLLLEMLSMGVCWSQFMTDTRAHSKNMYPLEIL